MPDILHSPIGLVRQVFELEILASYQSTCIVLKPAQQRYSKADKTRPGGHNDCSSARDLIVVTQTVSLRVERYQLLALVLGAGSAN
jgi:hypothetical protein